MASNKLQSRNKSILERRFIELTLQDAAKNWSATNNRRYSKHNFKGDYSQSFSVSNNTLTYEHLLKTRFIDMKRLNGQVKKRYPIHNSIVMGYFNGIIIDLQVGLTADVKAMLTQQPNIEI